MSRTLHLFGTECSAMMVPIHALQWYRFADTVSYNIRNDVAHGLLMPEEYTPYRALLVFMSILRLAKATRKIFIERSVKKDK